MLLRDGDKLREEDKLSELTKYTSVLGGLIEKLDGPASK